MIQERTAKSNLSNEPLFALSGGTPLQPSTYARYYLILPRSKIKIDKYRYREIVINIIKVQATASTVT